MTDAASASAAADREVSLAAPDGWVLGGLYRSPPGGATGAAVLVPGSRHERDAFTAVAAAFAAAGFASLRLDLRGRGASAGAGALSYSAMAPRQRRAVRADTASALGWLATTAELAPSRVAIVCEQDTAVDALLGACDVGCRRVVVLSARAVERALAQLRATAPAMLAIVSTEDRDGLRATVDAYLASSVDDSRLVLLEDRGSGATMLHTSPPGALQLENLIAEWLAHITR